MHLTRARIDKHTHTNHKHTHTRTHARARTHTYTHTYTRALTHTHTHTHTYTLSKLSALSEYLMGYGDAKDDARTTAATDSDILSFLLNIARTLDG